MSRDDDALRNFSAPGPTPRGQAEEEGRGRLLEGGPLGFLLRKGRRLHHGADRSHGRVPRGASYTCAERGTTVGSQHGAYPQLCRQLGSAAAPPKAQPPAAAPAVASLGEFHNAASSISREIHMTSQKLAELTRLVQQSRSLFNDPADQIAHLVHDISQDIQGLNGKLESAEQ